MRLRRSVKDERAKAIDLCLAAEEMLSLHPSTSLAQKNLADAAAAYRGGRTDKKLITPRYISYLLEKGRAES